MTVCRAEPEIGVKCKLLFLYCLLAKHFLLKNGSYVYKEWDFYDEDSYQKKIFIDFIDKLGYLGGEVPPAEAGRKHLNRLIDVSLLIGTCSREDLRIVFVKFETSFILLLLVYSLFVFVWLKIVFSCRCDEERVRVRLLKRGLQLLDTEIDCLLPKRSWSLCVVKILI